MADDTQGQGGAPAGNAQQPNQGPAPSFGIAGQYIRDLSFESPNAPGALQASQTAPNSQVNISVQVKKQSDELYAVELNLNVRTEREGTLLFAVELVYGGLFRLQNMPEAQVAPLLMVEAPRLLFPFARQILATVTQQGGFPPLMMEPVDFAALYRRNLAALAERRKAEEGQSTGNGGEPTLN